MLVSKQAVHATSDIFEEETTDVLLFVDASNAFNAINRQVLLHNIRYICPSMAVYVRNCYSSPSRIFVAGVERLNQLKEQHRFRNNTSTTTNPV